MLILIAITALILSARLGLGIFLQVRPKKRHLLLMLIAYLTIGFALGSLSESMASQDWLLWFLDEEKLILFQMAELSLSFILTHAALSSPFEGDSLAEGRVKRWVKRKLRPLLLLLPSPVVCFWMILAVGIIQTESVSQPGSKVGMALSGVFILLALLIRWFGRRAILLPDESLIGFILLHIMVAALSILLPATLNLQPMDTGDFNFPGQTTVLMIGAVLMIIGLGFVLPNIVRMLSSRIFSKRSHI